MILSNNEIMEYLELSSVSDKLAAIAAAVESYVKSEINRNFESQSYTKYYDISWGQDEIILPDHPVTALSVFSEVTDRDDEGEETLSAYGLSEYYLDEESGIISMYYGASLPVGRRTVKCVCTAGYTSEQITAGTLDEIRNAKMLIKTLVSREWALAKNDKRHISSFSFGEETTTYRFTLDAFQKSLIYKLQRKQF